MQKAAVFIVVFLGLQAGEACASNKYSVSRTNALLQNKLPPLPKNSPASPRRVAPHPAAPVASHIPGSYYSLNAGSRMRPIQLPRIGNGYQSPVRPLQLQQPRLVQPANQRNRHRAVTQNNTPLRLRSIKGK